MCANALDTDEDDAQTRPGSFAADLTAFQRDILYCILYREQYGRNHGLGIRDEMERRGYDEINHGRLYPNLDELVEEGLVEKAKADKRTNWYAVTDRGERKLLAHCRAEDDCLGEFEFGGVE